MPPPDDSHAAPEFTCDKTRWVGRGFSRCGQPATLFYKIGILLWGTARCSVHPVEIFYHDESEVSMEYFVVLSVMDS